MKRLLEWLRSWRAFTLQTADAHGIRPGETVAFGSGHGGTVRDRPRVYRVLRVDGDRLLLRRRWR